MGACDCIWPHRNTPPSTSAHKKILMDALSRYSHWEWGQYYSQEVVCLVWFICQTKSRELLVWFCSSKQLYVAHGLESCISICWKYVDTIWLITWASIKFNELPLIFYWQKLDLVIGILSPMHVGAHVYWGVFFIWQSLPNLPNLQIDSFPLYSMIGDPLDACQTI